MYDQMIELIEKFGAVDYKILDPCFVEISLGDGGTILMGINSSRRKKFFEEIAARIDQERGEKNE